MKPEYCVGEIYILVNPAFPDLVKIGYADNAKTRLNTLNKSSGLPDPYHCYAIYHVRKRLTDLVLHKLIDTLNPTLRHASNREFYEMDCSKAYSILSAIAQIHGSEELLIKNPFHDSYIAGLDEPVQEKTSKKSNLTFGMLEIPVGSQLVFSKDTDVVCTTIDETNHVEYNGEVYVISALAAKLLNANAAQGGLYFMYNGELLTDIRKRLNK